MKKGLFLAALAALFFLPACQQPNDPNNPNNPNNPDGSTNAPLPEVGTTYPRVQLIEHFTGEDCGYCPYGMDCIYEVYSANPNDYVWISNHYGFGTDEYSISESATIGKALGVQGAPSMSLNRDSYAVGGNGKSRNYHPGYITEIIGKPKTTATVKVELVPTYDAASGNLKVVVKGETSDPEMEGVMLTVAVTESGMQGKQADYYSSWEGWKKFTHTHTVRVYATAAMGDAIEFTKQRFSEEYNITIASGWKAENCQLVAWVTDIDTKYPVLNAAKTPVVAGTKGGEDIKHGGVLAVAVPADYPEEGAPVASFVVDQCQAQYQSAQGYTVFQLSAMSQTPAANDPQYGYFYPYLDIALAAEGNVTTIPAGTYNFSANPNVGDAFAGYRDDEAFELGGSQLYYVFSNGGSLYIGMQWLLVSGNITVSAEGFTLTATTLNGSSFSASYTGQIPCSRYTGNAPKYAVLESFADAKAAEQSRRFLFVK